MDFGGVGVRVRNTSVTLQNAKVSAIPGILYIFWSHKPALYLSIWSMLRSALHAKTFGIFINHQAHNM